MTTNDVLVHLLSDVVMEDNCSSAWQVEEGDTWFYHCSKHNTNFALDRSCPGSRTVARAGEQVYLAGRMAKSLVETGQAVYPTHAPVTEDGVQATVEKVNSLMDSMNLPHVDAESLKSISVKGKKGASHYAKPSVNRLSNDLGINPDDIDSMRNLIKGQD